MTDTWTPGSVALDDAIRTGIPPTWTEAVALIRAIAGDLDRSAPPLVVPNPSQVFVLPTGQIRISGGRPHARGAVAGMGHLLQSLLDHAAPTPLMEICQFAQADPPVYASLLELQQELEFFARPEGPAGLAGYYNRAARAMDVAVPAGDLDPPTPAPRDDEATSIGVHPREWRRWRVPVAIGLVATLGIAAGVRYQLDLWWRLAGSGWTVVTGVGSVGAAAGSATSSARGAGSDLGKSPKPAASPGRGLPPTAARAPTSAPRRADVRGDTQSSAVTPSVAAATPTAPEAPETIAPATPKPTGQPQRVPLPEVPAPLARSDTQPVPLLQAIVYSAANANVRPPELMSPQLPSERRVMTGEVAGDLELLVLEDGTVGEVQLAGPSNRVQDRMLLSAAKAWRFRPAQREGQPVKYRIRIPITW